ncbi:alpha-L-rhamnosidase [Eubacterium sp. am_0171]|uniref:alpha-L-rhamnosidase n=1 Tax=Faecalicatena contorta TaxID=39482 RepID=A0A173ZP46_9FIRM|nr:MULTISPECIES: family 78 glycoside hydrolase catalytic domain [Clostridia]MSC84880.1 Bacterial alpha-L-rhamnosidase [Eubacterium sp. BIOML-A1]MSD07168.1 Bacterial alpha-L-rhamnosidase [Eubacterium sp. BIOML-A2]RYT16080.1 alpha-L-rhamnosidase [Eubacterium sp. am_0171]CUN77360.1 Bacterial alpha-L-rhamnosidase [[Eubacterium] contortum] [Faecalicatena contorta]
MSEIGKWITNETSSPFYARKKFTVEKNIKKAEAKVCGLGQFHFYINGKKVEDHELDPGWTDYKKLIQYVTFDVTNYLKNGENVAGVEVGNGWFIKTDEHYTFKFPEFMPPNPNPYEPFGKYLMLALKMTVTYTDGTKDVITADDTFTVKEHPIVMSNVYGSETMDGRLVQYGWSTAEFDDFDWKQAVIVNQEDVPKGSLQNQFQPAVRVIHSYEGQLLNEVNGRQIYDFGQNMSGILEFEVKGHAGDVVKCYPAEKLSENGDVDQIAKNWVTVDSCITYIIGQDDVWETFRMKFTYFAGRYMAAEKISAAQTPAEIVLRSFWGHAISSASETNGTFTCDDERYNQIYNLVEKAVEANMVSVHTDCPTIERFAWQEPNHLMAPSIMYMKNGRKLWEKFLTDMRIAQHTGADYFLDFEGNKVYPGEGMMPSQCPCYIPNVLPVPGMGSFYDIIPWGGTSILGTYWHYQFYGDVKIIEDNYDAGMRYLNHLKKKVNTDGFINHGLGDWGNPRNELVRENIETAYLYADTTTLAKFAQVLGREKDREELQEFADRIKQNYNEKLLIQHPDHGFWCYRAWDHPDEIFLTQACEALPLYWGLVPEDKKEDIAKALCYTFERDQAFISGEIGLPYVIQTAREYGMNDIIGKFILKEEHPSYYAFVLDGETTLGEYWESNPRSHCHDMMGHIIEWFYNGIAGIQAEKPGFKQIKIQPYLPESIGEFICHYHSINGLIEVHVKKEGNDVLLEITIPKEIECRIDTCNLESAGRKIITAFRER